MSREVVRHGGRSLSSQGSQPSGLEVGSVAQAVPACPPQEAAYDGRHLIAVRRSWHTQKRRVLRSATQYCLSENC
jgi:hypothetical protein